MNFLVTCFLNGTFEMKELKILVKSSWKPPQGIASLEIFLSQIERELFEIPNKTLRLF